MHSADYGRPADHEHPTPQPPGRMRGDRPAHQAANGCAVRPADDGSRRMAVRQAGPAADPAVGEHAAELAGNEWLTLTT
jgi:hypothetical protein